MVYDPVKGCVRDERLTGDEVSPEQVEKFRKRLDQMTYDKDEDEAYKQERHRTEKQRENEVNSKLCVECNHPRAKHVRDVDGVVRCFESKSGTSTSGIIGIPFRRDCFCKGDEQMNTSLRGMLDQL